MQTSQADFISQGPRAIEVMHPSPPAKFRGTPLTYQVMPAGALSPTPVSFGTNFPLPMLAKHHRMNKLEP